MKEFYMDEPKAPPRPDPTPAPDYGKVHLGIEMDRARWTLPPASIVGIALLIVAVAVGAITWFGRYKPLAAATIDQVFAVEQSDKSSVLVTVQVTVRNTGTKAMFIRNLKGELKADGKTLTDDPASGVDYERYFQAYPALREHATAPLLPETRIPAGGEVKGTLMFGFGVSKEAFDKHELLSVTVEPYDHRPIMITDKPQPQ
jgi:hypothetical protein